MKIKGIKKAKRLVDDNSNLLITGPAGTGKTYLLEQMYNLKQDKSVKLALTGVAALNNGGSTIHRFLGTGISSNKKFVPAIMRSMQWRGVKNRIRNTNHFLIDEISMCRRDYFELADVLMRNALQIDRPFGGKKIVVFADFLQLPPVVKYDENLNNPWCFQSKIWKEANFSNVMLKKIYRQDDPEFIEALQKIREGRCNKAINKMMRSREGAKLKTKLKPVRFVATNQQVDEINARNLNKLSGRPKEFFAKIHGDQENYKKQLINDCLAPEHLILKKKAQVMVLINDKNCERFVNGSMGTITGFGDDKSPIVKIDRTGEEIHFGKFTWEKIDYKGNVLASFEQYPLKLAYAVTIHKSQGLTLDYASIDCSGIFAPGQAYVALSRVRTLDGLQLKNWDKSLIQVDEDALEFYRNDCVWE